MIKLHEITWQYFYIKDNGEREPFDDITCIDLNEYASHHNKQVKINNDESLHKKEFYSSLRFKFSIDQNKKIIYTKDGKSYPVFKCTTNNRYKRKRPKDNYKNSCA